MPTASDLVTDLPADFETFGQAVATSMADLLGGTTGQVLSKASNTNMDFTWVTTDDANAIQNAIVDAKGDLIAASAADTPARLAVGNNGETLVADSSATTGLRYQGNYAAGKNVVLNSDFRIAQRGTSFTSPTSGAYTLDRWLVAFDGTGATRTISQQTFTPGTAPVAGYEAANFIRCAQTVAGTSNTFVDFRQRIEDVRTFAGQTVTVSFWAKAAASQTVTILADQDFGSGGSSTVFNALPSTNITLTTSWQRFTYTASVASISGKTIGTSSFLSLTLRIAGGSTFTVDVFGVQMEAGSVATAFQTATGTLQGELAACQRYYFRSNASAGGTYLSTSMGATSGTTLDMMVPVLATLRTYPTSLDYSAISITDGVVNYSSGTWSINASLYGTQMIAIRYVHGSSALTQYRPYAIQATTSSGYIGLSAEL